MNLELLGALRPDRARKADRITRLRLSCPTARAFKRSSARLLRNSCNGETWGYTRAIWRNVLSPKSSWPLSNRGHGISAAASHFHETVELEGSSVINAVVAINGGN